MSHPGMLLPRHAVELRARTAGYLVRLDAPLGQRVKAGDLLGLLHDGALKAELKVAEARLASAQAEERRQGSLAGDAQRRAERARAGQQWLAPADLEKTLAEAQAAAAQSDIAHAQVVEQQARIEQLRQKLSELELRAPFSGAVAARYVEQGMLLQAGSAILRLISEDDLIVRCALPERPTERWSPGQRLAILLGTTAGTARIERAAPEIDVATQRVAVEAVLVGWPADAPAPRAGSPVWVKPLGPETGLAAR